MRISDWSSDVCSSDLQAKGGGEDGAEHDGGHLYSNEPWGSSGPGFFAAAGFGLSGAPAGCPAPPVAVALPPANSSSRARPGVTRSEEHTSELQSLMRISYAVFCLKKKQKNNTRAHTTITLDQM